MLFEPTIKFTPQTYSVCHCPGLHLKIYTGFKNMYWAARKLGEIIAAALSMIFDMFNRLSK